MIEGLCSGCGIEFGMYDQTTLVEYGTSAEAELCVPCAVPILAYMTQIGIFGMRRRSGLHPAEQP